MIKINKAGYIYVVLTILIGFSAVNTGNNLVYIITSALLSYMLVSGIFGRKNIYGIDVALEFPEEIYAGTDIPLRVTLRNPRRFMPAFLIKVLVNDREVLFPFVAARSDASQYTPMRFERRGGCRIAEIYLASVFPFNFFTRYRKLNRTHDLVIFPKPQACPWTSFWNDRIRAKGEKVSRLVGYDSDLISLREYVPGDPPKYIDWKATARSGSLKTKELSAIEIEHALIDFDRIEGRDLEQKLSCATFLILKLSRLNVPVGLSIGGEVFKPALSSSQKLRMLTTLALYDQD